MTDVFISYKREEREKVVLVADRLRALGLDVWFDARLTTGHHFDREIDQHVRKARCVLVCWSESALSSEWVRAEATIGRERGVIVPLLIEVCSPPVPFNTLQTENLVGWGGEGDHEGWLRALTRISELVARDDLVAAERERGAREVETRRIHAMLEAQEREEEQARRAAEAAAAERVRLEAELAARGATPVQRQRSPRAAPLDRRVSHSSPPPEQTTEQPRKGRFAWLVRVLIIVLLLGAGAGAGGAVGYYVGNDSGRWSERGRIESAALSRAVAALNREWCTSWGGEGPAFRDGAGAVSWRDRASDDWIYAFPQEAGSFGIRWNTHADGSSYQNSAHVIGDQLHLNYRNTWYSYVDCAQLPAAEAPADPAN